MARPKVGFPICSLAHALTLGPALHHRYYCLLIACCFLFMFSAERSNHLCDRRVSCLFRLLFCWCIICITAFIIYIILVYDWIVLITGTLLMRLAKGTPAR